MAVIQRYVYQFDEVRSFDDMSLGLQAGMRMDLFVGADGWFCTHQFFSEFRSPEHVGAFSKPPPIGLLNFVSIQRRMPRNDTHSRFYLFLMRCFAVWRVMFRCFTVRKSIQEAS